MALLYPGWLDGSTACPNDGASSRLATSLHCQLSSQQLVGLDDREKAHSRTRAPFCMFLTRSNTAPAYQRLDASVELNTAALDDRSPFGKLSLDMVGQLIRRRADDCRTELSHAFDDFGVL
jgi:hypothetical protein